MRRNDGPKPTCQHFFGNGDAKGFSKFRAWLTRKTEHGAPVHQERFFIISNIPEKPNLGIAGSQLLKSTAVRTIATYDELLLSVRPRRTVRKNQIINPLGSCKSTEKKDIPVPTESACGERFLKSSLLLFDVQVN